MDIIERGNNETMSAKINKDGKEYPIGVIPQNVIDDVAFLKNASNYSTTEHKVGKWIDGSDLYEKTIDCGALPNATTITIAHGISDIKNIVDIRGFAMNNAETIFIPLPFASKQTSGVETYADKTYITYETSTNRSTFVKSYVTLRYTKV